MNTNQVDEALRLVDKAPQAFVDAYGKDPVAVLAAEVRALRAMFARVQAACHRAQAEEEDAYVVEILDILCGDSEPILVTVPAGTEIDTQALARGSKIIDADSKPGG